MVWDLSVALQGLLEVLAEVLRALPDLLVQVGLVEARLGALVGPSACSLQGEQSRT